MKWPVKWGRNGLKAFQTDALPLYKSGIGSRITGMSSSIDPKTVRRIASLSRIRIEERDIPGLAEELDGIIAYFDKLNELDTGGVEPMTGPVEKTDVFRRDVVVPSLPREEGMANAPQRGDGYFTVPKVLGDS